MARVKAGASERAGLHSTPTRRYGEAALATYERGAVLVNSGGYVAEGGANPTNIIGVAMEDGENNATAGTKFTDVALALPHVMFEFSLDSAASLGRLTVAADRFSKFGITKHADGEWYIDIDKTGATARVIVMDFVDAVGTASGRVLAIFLATETIFGDV